MIVFKRCVRGLPHLPAPRTEPGSKANQVAPVRPSGRHGLYTGA